MINHEGKWPSFAFDRSAWYSSAKMPEPKMIGPHKHALSAEILYIATAILSGLGLLGKAGILSNFTHAPYAVVVPTITISLCACVFWRYALRFRRVLAPAVCVLLCAFFLFLFPRMEALHKLGRGSDQADCVIVAADRMIDHEWPYQPSEMSSKNAMSCGPGWVAMQAPAIRLGGYRLNLFLWWATCITMIGVHLGWDRTAAVLTLVGLSPGTWLTAANGSDFLTFGIAVLAFAVTIHGWSSRRHARPWWIIVAVLLGLLAQFRVVTLLMPAFFARQLSRGAVIAAWLVATVTVLAFLWWNPHAFVYGGPLHLAAKLMRGSVISDQPAMAAMELGFGSAVGFAAAYLVAERTHLRQPLLWFLLLVFFLPGMQDLILKYHRFGHVLRAFEFWEGGYWIQACVPLAAAGLLAGAHKDPPSTPFQ